MKNKKRIVSEIIKDNEKVLDEVYKNTKQKKFDLAGAIISYETGELRGDKVLELFSYLVKTGKAWVLQGSYGRQAQNLIDRGYLSIKGKILKTI